jgi:hypothetical protein
VRQASALVLPPAVYTDQRYINLNGTIEAQLRSKNWLLAKSHVDADYQFNVSSKVADYKIWFGGYLDRVLSLVRITAYIKSPLLFSVRAALESFRSLQY